MKISTSLGVPISVANGGTGQVSVQAAIDALTSVSSATNEYILTRMFHKNTNIKCR